MSKPRSFFFHFNKPASRAAGKPQISVHTAGKCHIVDNVICDVPTVGRIKKTAPTFVMTGKGFTHIGNGVAVLSKHQNL